MTDTSSAPVPEPKPGDRALFRVNPMSYIAVLILIPAILWPLATYPVALGWLVLLPIGFGWWIARTRTLVGTDGIHLSTWRSKTAVPWDEISGVMFPKRGFARLVTTDERSLAMGGVSFQDLPRLSAASGGRIRDPYATTGA